MTIWNDSAEAEEWSQDPLSNNPLRREQLDLLLSVIGETYQNGNSILDLGLGSGLVEERLFQQIKDAQVIGVDASPAMLALARQRLADHSNHCRIYEWDLRNIDRLQLPERDYQIAFSVQTLHHLDDRDKQDVIQFVYDLLEIGGSFFILDRLSIGSPRLFDMYRILWARNDELYGSRQAEHEGRTFEEHRSARRKAGDVPASLTQHLNWLRQAGFEAACLHLHTNRGLLVGVKS